MSEFSLESVFKTDGLERGNFLSRVFGLFNEEPVRLWAEMESSPYEYLGRPTLYPKEDSGWTTLDFAFRRREDGRIFVAEMKCEIAYESFRYMTLTRIEQVQRHLTEQKRQNKKSFPRFLEAARYPDRFQCRVTSRSGQRRDVAIDGAILVWGSVSVVGRKAVQSEFGFADILSVEEIINDLIQSGDASYAEFVRQRGQWSDELFQSLLGNQRA